MSNRDRVIGASGDSDAGGRTGPLVNGALIALGALAIVDNVVAHWLLQLHRAVPGPSATAVEIGLIVLGAVLLLVGLWRERRARRLTPT